MVIKKKENKEDVSRCAFTHSSEQGGQAVDFTGAGEVLVFRWRDGCLDHKGQRREAWPQLGSRRGCRQCECGNASTGQASQNRNSWDFRDLGELLVKSSGFGGILWAGFLSMFSVPWLRRGLHR